MLAFKQTLLSRWNPRRRWITGLAVVSLLVIVTLAALNAAATPRSLAEVRIAGWVSDLQSDTLTARRHEAQRQLELSGETAVPQLLVALRSDDVVLRTNAADVLGYIASPRATEGLLNALREDAAPAVRRNAARALGESKDPRAWNDLVQSALADRSPMVRGAAADSLARIRTSLALAARLDEQLVTSYAVAPSSPQSVYLAAKRDLHVSRDGGATWTELSSVLPGQATALTVAPDNAGHLYAGVEGTGLFTSHDGGASWIALNTGLTWTAGGRQAISAIAVDPADPSELYAAHGVWLGSGSVAFYPLGLIASHDGGTTWQSLSAGSDTHSISGLVFRQGQLYGLAGDRVLTLVTPRP